MGLVSTEVAPDVDIALDDVVGSRRARRLIDAVVHGAPDPSLASAPPEVAQGAVRLLGCSSVDEAAIALGCRLVSSGG
jgi:hypothetical protein